MSAAMIQAADTLEAPAPFDATLTGAAGDDRLDGSDLNDLIQGLGGDDLLQGLGGDDLLEGGAGDDTLLGGSGADTLDGGGGQNVLNGGSGADLFYLNNLVDVTVDGGSGRDTLSFIHMSHGVTLSLRFSGAAFQALENVVGSDFNDDIGAGAHSGVLYGRGGDDTLYNSTSSSAANVKLVGGVGDDTLYSSPASDTLKGGAGDDLMQGANAREGHSQPDLEIGGGGDDWILVAWDDTVMGGGGADTLYVLEGDNTMSGGGGADTFAFGSEFGSFWPTDFGVDLITDLTSDDTLDLSFIDADTTATNDQAFTLVAALDGHAGQAALVYDSGADETALLLDTDGDGAANITVRLTGDQTGFTHFVL